MKGKKQIKRKQSEAKGIPKGKSRRLEGADERDRRIGAPATAERPRTLTYFAAHRNGEPLDDALGSDRGGGSPRG